MRKKNNLEARLSACRGILICRLFNTGGEPGTDIINYRDTFGNDNPVWLEIGCGKGGFVNRAARLHPCVNFIAVEKSENVAVSALERTVAEGLPNIRYIIGMAEYLDRVLPPGSIEALFLNFSCPFPKVRHEKHRLTHKSYLGLYSRLLKRGSVIHFKTDNSAFFDYSADSFAENGFALRNVSRDLHNSGITGNIITEYEDYFIRQGKKINYLEAELK
jgi:tRNA (guanine-N7-)-methyltransferase